MIKLRISVSNDPNLQNCNPEDIFSAIRSLCSEKPDVFPHSDGPISMSFEHRRNIKVMVLTFTKSKDGKRFKMGYEKFLNKFANKLPNRTISIGKISRFFRTFMFVLMLHVHAAN